MSNRWMGDRLGWVGTLLGGAWLAIWVARCMAASTEWAASAVRAAQPVRVLVEEALEEHPADDTVMAHAFEEALADETSEALADAR